MDSSPEGQGPRPLVPPIPPATPVPPRVPPPAASPGAHAPRIPSQYRPPSQVESKPVYVDPKMLVGLFACAVILLFGLYYLKNRGAAPAAAKEAVVTLRAGQDVKRNLGGAEWASLSIPSDLGKGTLLKTSGDTRNVLVLADGSSVRLDANTSAKIVSVEQSGDQSRLSLLLYRGRIYVNEGPKAEVAVETKFLQIAPVGTRFSVSQVERSDLTEFTSVQVYDGSVRLTHAEDASTSLVVKAGEQATAAAAVLESPKPSAAKDTWIAWNESWAEIDKITGGGAAAAVPGAPQVQIHEGPPPGAAPPAAGGAPQPPAGAAAMQPQAPTGPPQPIMQGGPPPGQPFGQEPTPHQPMPPQPQQPYQDPNFRPGGPPPAAGPAQPPQPPEPPRIPQDIQVEDRRDNPPPEPGPGGPPNGPGGPGQDGPGPPPPGGGGNAPPVESASDGDSGLGTSYPSPAPVLNTTAPPGYSPGSESKGPSGPVYQGY